MVNEWIRHSDAKASVTLAFTGVMATMTYNLAKDVTSERVKLFVCGVRFIGICRSGRGRPRPFG